MNDFDDALRMQQRIHLKTRLCIWHGTADAQTGKGQVERIEERYTKQVHVGDCDSDRNCATICVWRAGGGKVSAAKMIDLTERPMDNSACADKAASVSGGIGLGRCSTTLQVQVGV